jgi:hypothetical protein
MARQASISVVLAISLGVILIVSCSGRNEKQEASFELPWPDMRTAQFLQTRVDSSEYQWFTDVKATASSYINEMIPSDKIITVGDVVILGEGLFHAKAEVQLESKVLVLTLERPFKERGRKSIWQVIKVEEKTGQKPG